jgi:hypothetical protein
MSNMTIKESLCMTCYERGVRRSATRGPSPDLIVFCFQCWLDVGDQRCLLEAMTDTRPENVSVN